MGELGAAETDRPASPPNLITMRTQRLVSLVVGLALVAAACGGGDGETVTPAEATPTTQGGDATPATASPSTEPGTSPATEPTEATQPSAERPAPDPTREIAPDFSLPLGDGSTFVLSEEIRPVFMVFWAEW